MGLTSILLRLPAVMIAHAAGANTAGEYRAGALMCFVAAALVCIWLAWYALEAGVAGSAVAALLVLFAAAIVWSRAAFFGHPEEPLAAALAIAAVVQAHRGRWLAAGILLGLAIGTKEWALLAAPAVAFAGSADVWRRMAVPAVVVTALMIAPFLIGNPTAFRAAHEAARAGQEHTNTPANIWFRFGHKELVAQDAGGTAYAIYPSDFVGRNARPLVFLICLLTAPLYFRRHGFGSLEVLGLVAFLFLLRVVLDTQTFSYHHVPMLMAVAAWEVIARRRFPFVAIAAAAAFQLTARVVAPDLSADAFNALYLAWTLPLAAYLAVAVLGPASDRRRNLLARGRGRLVDG